MKTTKIVFWTSTVLFAGFMALSAIPDIMMSAEAVDFIKKLGYPEYFIPFIGTAKLLGSVALLVPSFKRIKEWAYAGLFYDLIATAYSIIMVAGFDAGMIMMFLIFAVGITSYIFNRKYYGHKD